MDIVAHMLWAGVGAALLSRRRALRRRDVAGIVASAALPDIVQFVPLAAWVAAGDGSMSELLQHALARPGEEPALPEWVQFYSHHLHCILHSAVVAAGVTAIAWLATRTPWWPLLGWWSHIVIDVFTHSAEFYAVPVLYPLSGWTFDGIAWNEPWLMALNYAALAASALWVRRLRQVKPRAAAASNNDDGNHRP